MNQKILSTFTQKILSTFIIIILGLYLSNGNCIENKSVNEKPVETSSNQSPFDSSSEVFKVKGMHCGACIESIKEQVCNHQKYAKCDVQIGQVQITPLPGKKLNKELIKKQVQKAGHYRVTSVEKWTPQSSQSIEKADPMNCPEVKGENEMGTCSVKKDESSAK